MPEEDLWSEFWRMVTFPSPLQTPLDLCELGSFVFQPVHQEHLLPFRNNCQPCWSVTVTPQVRLNCKPTASLTKLGRNAASRFPRAKLSGLHLNMRSAVDFVLIPPEHRTLKGGEKDIVFDNDPWAKSNKSNGDDSGTPMPKRRPRKPGQVAKVDLSFFHASQKPLQQIEFAQLLQG